MNFNNALNYAEDLEDDRKQRLAEVILTAPDIDPEWSNRISRPR